MSSKVSRSPHEWFGLSTKLIKAEIAATGINIWDDAPSALTHVDNGSFSFQVRIHLHVRACKAGAEESADVKLSME